MKTLIVGGSGLVGGEIALYLNSLGHEVTIMARKPPLAPDIAALPFLQGDYVSDRFSEDQLYGFDSLVFAAAADIRYMPVDGSVTPRRFFTPRLTTRRYRASFEPPEMRALNASLTLAPFILR